MDILAAGTAAVTVVKHNGNLVGSEPNIKLNGVHAQFQSRLERDHGILRILGAKTSMPSTTMFFIIGSP